MKFNLFLGICLGLILMLPSSCKKDDNTVETEFINSSEDLTSQQDLLEDNESEVADQLALGFQAFTTRGYPTRTWAQPKGTYPNTLTIDYGTAGVLGKNDRVRRGKIIITISAPLNTTGAVRTVSHEDFYVDDVHVEGTVVLTNLGPNGLGQNVFTRNVNNRVLTFPSGKTISWNAAQTMTQLEGSSTTDKSDDKWSIQEVSTGVNRAGKNFSVTTIEPLIKTDCRWVVKGVVSITVDTKTLSINFGDGACNNAAIVTLPDGTTKEVNIKRWW